MTQPLSHPPRLLIIGLDGGSLEFLEDWSRQGLLPHFREFFEQGVSGPLTSIIPPITAAAWTSFMTGKNPGKHGLFDFMEPEPFSYEMRYTNAHSRRADTIWGMLNAAGLKVGVFNVPMTYPPDPVDGFMIAGMDTPHRDCAYVQPPEVHEELKARFGQVDLEPRHLGFMKHDGLRAKLLQEIKQQETRRTDMLLYLLERKPVDVAMLVYRATDIVQHFFWHYLDPAHHWHAGVREHAFAAAIREVYVHLDAEVGRLLDALPVETPVAVMSDHGAGAVGDAIFYPNRFLAQEGFLARQHAAAPTRRWGARLLAGLDAWLRGRLTPEAKAWLAHRLPTLRRRWEASFTGYSQIDWSRTRAFANEVLALTPGVWINLKGRFPQGVVEPGREYDEVTAEVKGRLEGLTFRGRRLIPKVYHREELYTGPYLEQAPDLILNWWESASFVCRPSFAGSLDGPAVEGAPDFTPEQAEWTGTHRLDGVVLLKGGPCRRGVRLSGASILDLAPTALHLLGQPVPADFDGRVLAEALEPAYLEAHPVRTGGAADAPRALAAETYSEAERDSIEEKLKQLGYLE